MNKQRAIIIDDEIDSLNNLCYLLNTYCGNDIEIIAQTSSPQKAIVLINDLKPDILFLDIKMPNIDGFQLLEQLEQHNFFLVFTTAYSEYGIRALKASAIDYLLKPIDPVELKGAIDKIKHLVQLKAQSNLTKTTNKNAIHLLLNNLTSNSFPKQIMIPHQDQLKMVNVSEIVSIAADINYSIVHMLDDTKYLVAKTLKSFEELLDTHSFLRIHKSYIINLFFIKETIKSDQYYIILKNEQRFPIARRRVKMVMDKIRLQ